MQKNYIRILYFLGKYATQIHISINPIMLHFYVLFIWKGIIESQTLITALVIPKHQKRWINKVWTIISICLHRFSIEKQYLFLLKEYKNRSQTGESTTSYNEKKGDSSHKAQSYSIILDQIF